VTVSNRLHPESLDRPRDQLREDLSLKIGTASRHLLKSAIGRLHIDGCDVLFVLIEVRVAQGHTLL
jgi:hypothetical protein